jgi:hypothetical protein
VLDGKKLGEHTVRLGEVKKGAFAGVFMFSLFIEKIGTLLRAGRKVAQSYKVRNR